jgi:DNA-binding Lrp family transcriptional regulator
VQSYVLIKCTPGYEKEIMTQLKPLPEIIEINGVWGKYDIFVKISDSDPVEIEKAISKIRKMKQVVETETMMVLYGQGGTIDD